MSVRVYLFTDKGLMSCTTESLWGKRKWWTRTPRKLKKKQKKYAYKVKVRHRKERIKESIELTKHNKVMINTGGSRSGKTGTIAKLLSEYGGDVVMPGAFRNAIDEKGKSKIQNYFHSRR